MKKFLTSIVFLIISLIVTANDRLSRNNENDESGFCSFLTNFDQFTKQSIDASIFYGRKLRESDYGMPKIDTNKFNEFIPFDNTLDCKKKHIVYRPGYKKETEDIIVVGIDNADEYRSNELFMNPSTFGELSLLATAIPEDDFSKGYLENLSEFMVKSLHPFIKEKYCVNDDNIGIGGSSMGGIASFYCALLELGFYSYVLSYSPAFGLYEMSAFENYFSSKDFALKAEILPRIHIYCGGGDPLEQMLLPSSKTMKSALERYGYPTNIVYETYDDEKPHNEESWRLVLYDSFTKLFDLK